MKVKLYTYNADGGEESFEGEHDLTAVLPEPDDEQAIAYQTLRDEGRYWGGGGASPLFLLMRVG